MKQEPGDRSWQAIRRCLALARRLMRGPAGERELMAHVRQEVDPYAYSERPSAARRAFKEDLARLRHRLDVGLQYDRDARQYELEPPGALALLDLPDEHLMALNILYSTFEAHESPIAPVKPLLDHLVGLLPAARQQALAEPARVMRVEMPELDAGRIPPRVSDRVERAIRRRRQLAFNYYSPQQADGLPRYWVVAPVQLRFRRGHWYLLCWQVYWRSHLGEGHDSTYRTFRLQYIADDEMLEVLPTKVSVEHRRPRRVFVQYLLKPPVGRGDISRYFQEMAVEVQPDGSALVKGFCDDAWDAVRTLLGYGENCVVLGGDEVLSLMRRRVAGMAENYGFGGSS